MLQLKRKLAPSAAGTQHCLTGLGKVGLTEGGGGERGENESWWGLWTAAPTPGKEEGEKRNGHQKLVETVPTLCQGSEASASCGDGAVGGGGIRPQSNSHGPSWTKQAPCPQTSHILVASCSSSQDIGGDFPIPPFPQGCQGCQWDLNSAPREHQGGAGIGGTVGVG